MSDTIDIQEIKTIIPHRFPFLLVDRVTEIEGTETIRGYKHISANEPVFQGHFPENPIFPGVMIIEAMAQLGAILIMRLIPEGNRMAYFAGIDKVRFKRLVIPGDRLDLETTIIRDRGTFVQMQGRAYIDGKLAAEATFLSALAK